MTVSLLTTVHRTGLSVMTGTERNMVYCIYHYCFVGTVRVMLVLWQYSPVTAASYLHSTDSDSVQEWSDR